MLGSLAIASSKRLARQFAEHRVLQLPNEVLVSSIRRSRTIRVNLRVAFNRWGWTKLRTPRQYAHCVAFASARGEAGLRYCLKLAADAADVLLGVLRLQD